MNEFPRKKLSELVNKYGRSICDDPHRCESLLRDLCSKYKPEVNVLIGALKEGIPAQLLGAATNVPRELILAKLVTRLQASLAMTDEAARWAVESWAIALGMIAEAAGEGEKVIQKDSLEKSEMAVEKIQAFRQIVATTPSNLPVGTQTTGTSPLKQIPVAVASATVSSLTIKRWVLEANSRFLTVFLAVGSFAAYVLFIDETGWKYEFIGSGGNITKGWSIFFFICNIILFAPPFIQVLGGKGLKFDFDFEDFLDEWGALGPILLLLIFAMIIYLIMVAVAIFKAVVHLQIIPLGILCIGPLSILYGCLVSGLVYGAIWLSQKNCNYFRLDIKTSLISITLVVIIISLILHLNVGSFGRLPLIKEVQRIVNNSHSFNPIGSFSVQAFALIREVSPIEQAWLFLGTWTAQVISTLFVLVYHLLVLTLYTALLVLTVAFGLMVSIISGVIGIGTWSVGYGIKPFGWVPEIWGFIWGIGCGALSSHWSFPYQPLGIRPIVLKLYTFMFCIICTLPISLAILLLISFCTRSIQLFANRVLSLNRP
jgi:hypothetical protein